MNLLIEGAIGLSQEAAYGDNFKIEFRIKPKNNGGEDYVDDVILTGYEISRIVDFFNKILVRGAVKKYRWEGTKNEQTNR